MYCRRIVMQQAEYGYITIYNTPPHTTVLEAQLFKKIPFVAMSVSLSINKAMANVRFYRPVCMQVQFNCDFYYGFLLQTEINQ